MANIVVFGVVALAAAWGFKSGFIRSVFHLGYYVISAVAAAVLYPVLSRMLAGSPLVSFIHDKIIMPRLKIDAGAVNLPSFMQKAVEQGISNTTEALATAFTDAALNIICFVAVFIVVRFGLKLVAGILDRVARLPVLNTFNRVGGIAVGTLNGFAVVYLLLGIATIFMTDKIYGFISSSDYVLQMYNNNILLKLLFG